MKLIAQIAVAAAATFGLNSASAVLMYDQDITPDVIYGSGNHNGAWTVNTENNIEVGLRAKVRGANVFNSNADGTYNHDSGFSSGSAAKWNFDFSINLNADGQSNPERLFDDPSVGYLLLIDNDPSAGISWIGPLDVLSIWNDNEFGTNATGNGGGDADAATNSDNGASEGYYVVQNSQNVGWMPLGIDVTAPGTYDISLFVRDYESERTLALTSITVLVDGGGASVPEPAILGLLGMGLLGLGAARRRR